MHISNYILLCGTFASALLISGCGDNDIFMPPADPSEGPPTGIADQNSFSLARSIVAVEGLAYDGVTSDVTARVADRHNHPVPDGTVIHFLTNGGAIEPQCIITNGACTAIWNSQNPRPVLPASPGIARIIAYTDGEESFTDLNDNDAFDAGEPIFEASEPYIDANENGVFDAGTEEFVDRDNDKIFDAADGLYTGQSCVGDNTVCDRKTLYTWSTTRIVMSSSAADVSFSPSSVSIAPDTSTTIYVIVLDANGNQMAEETEVKIEVTDGTVDTASFTIGVGTDFSTVVYTAPSAAGTDILKVTVTSPISRFETIATLPITVEP